LANALAEDFKRTGQRKSESGESLFVALSGGNSPRIFFERLSLSPYPEEIPWNNVHFFWGDERCVPPDDTESNFKMAYDALLSHVPIPDKNIHRIMGEKPPRLEVKRYEKEIQDHIPQGKNGLPQFGWIFLGMGEDGHTASLFPGATTLFEKEAICVVAEHPASRQKRISLTLPVINNATRVSFLVTGEEKASIVSEILKKTPSSLNYPSAKVQPDDGILEWYLDKSSAREL
ncbi:MAG TPA: 6-phosphogluconolactonase, partial [Thermodesulfobacteriota bacterium]